MLSTSQPVQFIGRTQVCTAGSDKCLMFDRKKVFFCLVVSISIFMSIYPFFRSSFRSLVLLFLIVSGVLYLVSCSSLLIVLSEWNPLSDLVLSPALSPSQTSTLVRTVVERREVEKEYKIEKEETRKQEIGNKEKEKRRKVEDNIMSLIWNEWKRPRSNSFCDLNFGNGYTEKIDVCSSSGGNNADASSVQCLYNSRLGSSICDIDYLVIDRPSIRSARGGEAIDEVVGRSEEQELCNYAPGAFEVNMCIVNPNWHDVRKFPYHMNKIMSNLQFSPSKNFKGLCQNVTNEPVLFVTRYEYANLYHTMTDWFNVYSVLRMYNLPFNTMIVFLDGHSAGALDSGWTTLFGANVKYIHHFEAQKLCFRKSYLVPPGYNSILSINFMNPSTYDCKRNNFLVDFSTFVVNAFGFPVVLPSPSPLSRKRVKVLFRRDYKAHPRNSNRPSSRKIENEDEVMAAVKDIFTDALIEKLSFESMSMFEQIKAIREADILIGFHGAGLSHVLFLPPHALLIELTCGQYAVREHFKFFAQWSGVLYKRIDISKLVTRDDLIHVDIEIFKRESASALLLYEEALARISGTVSTTTPTQTSNFFSNITRVEVRNNESLFEATAIHSLVSKKIAEGSNPPFYLPQRPIQSRPHRLAIIVPFRDSLSNTSQGFNRLDNLKIFIPHMLNHLKQSNFEFRIFVVEQAPGFVFNKGALFNIGFQLVKWDFDYICLHDVDQIPLSQENTYDFPKLPTHLCSASSQFQFKIAYDSMVGGAFLLQTAHFQTMNGLSNKYFGWGQEDDDLYNRVILSFGSIARLPVKFGRYQALNHARIKGLDHTLMFNQGRKQLLNANVDYSKDGVKQVNYRVVKYSEYDTHDRILVDILLDFMPKSLDETAPPGFY